MADAKRPQTYQEQSFVLNQIQKALPKTQAEIENQNDENVPLEARSAFLSSFGTGMDGIFDPRLGLLGNGNGQFSQYLSCPVNIPFCNRRPCLNRFGQTPQFSENFHLLKKLNPEN